MIAGAGFELKPQIPVNKEPYHHKVSQQKKTPPVLAVLLLLCQFFSSVSEAPLSTLHLIISSLRYYVTAPSYTLFSYLH